MALKHCVLSARLNGVKPPNTTGFKHIAYNPVAVEYAIIVYVGVK